MSSNQDFASPSSDDSKISLMYKALPRLRPNSIWVDTLAGIMWLDTARGIAREGDYILISRWIAGWLTMEFDVIDPEISRIQTDGLFGEPVDENDPEFNELISKPFKIRITNDAMIPENVRGKEILIAVMSEAETDAWGDEGIFAISKHADDTFVGPEIGRSIVAPAS